MLLKGTIKDFENELFMDLIAFDRRIRNKKWRIRNVQQLEVVSQEEYENMIDIPQRQIADLIFSIRSHCNAVINADGAHTPY